MVVVMGPLAIAAGISMIAGTTVGAVAVGAALIGRGGGNQASQVMSAQQNIKHIVKNSILKSI